MYMIFLSCICRNLGDDNNRSNISIEAASAHCKSSRKKIGGECNVVHVIDRNSFVHSLIAFILGFTAVVDDDELVLADSPLFNSGVRDGNVL